MSETAVNYLPEVRAQYEDYPYPERNPEDEKKRLGVVSGARMDAVNHFCFRGRQDFNNFRVLVAGGGTGDSAICWAEQLRERDNTEVVYLDMSAASMKVAQKRAQIRKLDNIKWVNDSLLNVGGLGLGTFDFVDCSGVLHHLKDPDAGLKALRSVMKLESGMHLMVYAKYGRTAIYMIQDLMRLINGGEQDPREKIKNTKNVLKFLPEYHWFNVSEKSGIWQYPDKENDPGIHDLFLHSQDRAYTILEVHDWLARCGIAMAGEPGDNNEKKLYLPEMFIKDEKMLAKVKAYPLKIRQAIGELLCGKIAKHTFLAAPREAGEMEAQLTDEDMVVCKGILPFANFGELARDAIDQRKDFTATYNPPTLANRFTGGGFSVYVPEGKYVGALLNQIDGQRTVGEILDGVRNSPKHKEAGIDEARLRQDFETLFKSLNRGACAYLRHKSVPPFRLLSEVHARVDKMYSRG